MDLIGVIILTGSLICFILALTQGPIDGWKSASFIAPFVLAFPLAIGFFFWGELSHDHISCSTPPTLRNLLYIYALTHSR